MGISKSNRNPNYRPHGQYGSYGDKNLITFQSKVDRELYRKFDVVRGMMGKSRRKCLEEFFQSVIDQHDSSKGLFQYMEEK